MHTLYSNINFSIHDCFTLIKYVLITESACKIKDDKKARQQEL